MAADDDWTDATMYSMLGGRQQGKTAMLGDAMMRAGVMETAMAERKRLTPMSFNKYRTPTAGNVGCEWSLGILNMTEEEVNVVADFASRLSRERGEGRGTNDYRPASGPAPTNEERLNAMMANGERLNAMMAGVKDGTISKSALMEEIRRMSMDREGYDVVKRAALLTNIMQDERDERRKYLTDDRDKPIAEKTEPVVKGNRFSGLDIE